MLHSFIVFQRIFPQQLKVVQSHMLSLYMDMEAFYEIVKVLLHSFLYHARYDERSVPNSLFVRYDFFFFLIFYFSHLFTTHISIHISIGGVALSYSPPPQHGLLA